MSASAAIVGSGSVRVPAFAYGGVITRVQSTARVVIGKLGLAGCHAAARRSRSQRIRFTACL
jgi:hypothetical protein